jgi:hypothetical protein
MKLKIALAVFVVFALTFACVLHYYLPRKELVTITGIDSKRAEGIPVDGDRSDNGRSFDIYYIYVLDADNTPRILSNENTAWGFPPYFKFDAADMQSKAINYVGKKVVIRYYGWRITYLNLFQNITSFEPGDEASSLTSWVRLSVYGLWAFILILIFPRYVSLFRENKPKSSK